MTDYVGEFFTPPFYLFETGNRPSLTFDALPPPDPMIGDYEAWGGAAPTTYYMQRVYDITLAAWCYYTFDVIDDSPDSGDTTPNHTGNLRPGAHDVLRIYTA